MPINTGRNFLHTPGPTNVPERVLAAMMRPAVDLSDPAYLSMIQTCFEDLGRVFRTDGRIFIYMSNGHGAWEAALVNTLSPGDKVLAPEVGHFSRNWAEMASVFGVEVDVVSSDWRHALDPEVIEARLRADTGGEIKAVLMVQTDTATAITSDITAVRQAIDAAGHPALLMVDIVASLAAAPFDMDAMGVDVAVAASQKGLMQPPGLGIVAANDRAWEAHRKATLPRLYWDWTRRAGDEYYRRFCGTSPIHLLYGLREALDMLLEEGLDNVVARHGRLAEGVRKAVEVWSRGNVLEFNAIEPADRCDSVTTICIAEGYDADVLRLACRGELDLSLGAGLGDLGGRAFRIGHLGYLNEAMVLGALATVETALTVTGIPYEAGGVDAAIRHFAETHRAQLANAAE